MGTIWTILKTVLGFTAEASTGNKVSGALNYAMLIPVATWLWFNKANAVVLQILFDYKGKTETITLLTTTVGGLSLVAGGVFVYLEYLRRSKPGQSAIPPTAT